MPGSCNSEFGFNSWKINCKSLIVIFSMKTYIYPLLFGTIYSSCICALLLNPIKLNVKRDQLWNWSYYGIWVKRVKNRVRRKTGTKKFVWAKRGYVLTAIFELTGFYCIVENFNFKRKATMMNKLFYQARYFKLFSDYWHYWCCLLFFFLLLISHQFDRN